MEYVLGTDVFPMLINDGMVVLGPFNDVSSLGFTNSCFAIFEKDVSNMELSRALQQFWEVESIPIFKPRSEDEKKCEKNFLCFREGCRPFPRNKFPEWTCPRMYISPNTILPKIDQHIFNYWTFHRMTIYPKFLSPKSFSPNEEKRNFL